MQLQVGIAALSPELGKPEGRTATLGYFKHDWSRPGEPCEDRAVSVKRHG